MQYKDMIDYDNEIQRGGWTINCDKNGMKISNRR